MSDGAEAAIEYHEATKHSVASVRASAHPLDWSNLPLPLKHYPDLDPIMLPVELPERDRAAVDVLAGRVDGGGRAELSVAELTRLLFLSAGVTRRARLADGRPMFFRAAPSAGALYPVEVYVVCGDLPGLDAGVYHFGPAELALRRLRGGDHRGFLARACAEPSIAERPASLVLTGIPWRTTWKYRERGYRHLYWDSGTILGNLLAAAESAGFGARILTAFVDGDVTQLLALGDLEEYPLAVVPLEGAGSAPPAGDEGPPEPVEHRVMRLSAKETVYTPVTRMQRASDLESAAAVESWRRAAVHPAREATGEVPSPEGGEGSLEDIVVRRGSTRRYAREAVSGEALRFGLAAATRPVPADFLPSGGTLLEHHVAVHAVEGVAPGAYRWDGGALRPIREGLDREATAHLCLDQPLGGDSAYAVAHGAHLPTVLDSLGARGYRAAQLEAGIVAGRLHLAAYALGVGASGITFYDDEVSEHFGTEDSPMLTTTVGVPGYRSRPGHRPSEVDRLRIESE